jgi:hypothetical protein
MFFLVFVLIDFGFYVKEAVDWHATVSVSTTDRRVVSYLFPLATTAHAFLLLLLLLLVIVVIVVIVLVCTSTAILILFFLVFVLVDFGFYVKEAVDQRVFVASLATVLVSTTDRSVSYLFPLATTAHAFLVVLVVVLVVTVVFILVVICRFSSPSLS